MTEAGPGNGEEVPLEQHPAHTTELEDWLASTFRAENALLRERLQKAVWAQLELHNESLAAAVTERLKRDGVGLFSDAPVDVQVVPGAAVTSDMSLEVSAFSSESAARALVNAAGDAAKWQDVYDKAHPLGAKERAVLAVGRTASAVREAATDRVVAYKQRPQGQRDRGESKKQRQESLIPDHLHTEEPVTIHPSLSRSLEVLKNNLESVKGGKRGVHGDVDGKKEYQTSELRELAGQHSEQLQLGVVSRFVRSNRFEFCSGMVILACTTLMVVEIQYAGYNSGFDLDMPGYNKRGTEEWPGAENVFEAFNTTFNVIFLVELLLRIGVFRMDCLWNAWMYFDCFLVTCGWLDGLGLLEFGMDPMILRVARLSRMLRLLKALRAVRALETLFLLVRSLQASLGALFWSFALLWCAQVVTGILLCQLLREFIDDKSKDADARRQVFNYFGTFSHATITMFEITLANWVVSCRLLYTHVSGWYGMFFILYRGCFMFAVIKVISAVFLAETARCANSDDNIAVHLKQKHKEIYCRKMATIFMELDKSHDGFLSSEEFAPIMTDELLKTWLTTLEIDTQDLDQLFEILDTGDDKIDLDEFTRGMTRIKGPAKSIDVLKLQVATSQLGKKLDALLQSTLHAPDPLASVNRSCDAGLASYPSHIEAMEEKPLAAPVETTAEPLSVRSADSTTI